MHTPQLNTLTIPQLTPPGNAGEFVRLAASRVARASPVVYKIMILGDSLVYGVGDGPRGAFERTLRAKGARIRLIGTQINFKYTGTNPGPVYTNGPYYTESASHQGHGGHMIAQAAADYLAAIPICGVPDCVLLRTGTNDIYVQGQAIFAGTITLAAALASMQADMTALVAVLLASGVRVVGVCDIPRVGTLHAAPAKPVESNLLADAWNSGLDAFAEALPHGATQVVSAAHYAAQITDADFVSPLGSAYNDYVHVNSTANNLMGVAAARWLESVATLASGDPVPRLVKGYGPARAHAAVVNNTDRVEVPATCTALVLPNGEPFEISFDYFCTALAAPAAIVPMYQYGSTVWTDGVTLYLYDGGKLRWYFKDLGPVADQRSPTCIKVGMWHRIRARIDTVRKRVAVMVNGCLVDDFSLGGDLALNLAAQKSFLGKPSSLGGTGALGYYGRLSVHSGPKLGTWDDFPGLSQIDFFDSVPAPGVRGEILLCEGTGTNIKESVTGVTLAGALVGTTWAAAGVVPKWCEQYNEPGTMQGASPVLINGDTLPHDPRVEPIKVSLLANTTGLDVARPAATAALESRKYGPCSDTGVVYEVLGGAWKVASALYGPDRAAVGGWYTNAGLYCPSSPLAEPDLADLTAFAICWYAPQAPSGATMKTIFAHGDSAKTARGLALFYSRVAGSLSKLELLCVGPGGSTWNDLGVAQFSAPSMHCLFIARAGGNFRSSLDGAAVAVCPVPGTFVTPLAADPMSIGMDVAGVLSAYDSSVEFVSFYPFSGISADTAVLDPLLRAASAEGFATGRITTAVGTLGAPLNAAWWPAGAVHYTATRAGGASPVEWGMRSAAGVVSPILYKRAR